MVLDGVVCPAIEKLGNLCPSVAQGLMGEKQKPLLMVTPFLLFDRRVQMIMPSLSTLLANSP